MLYQLSPFIACLLCFFMVYRLALFNLQEFSRLFILLLFLCKAFAGLVVAHFSADILSGTDGNFYFQSGKVLQEYGLQHPYNYFRLLFGIHGTELSSEYFSLLNWKNLPAFNDGETMLKLNSLLHFISFNNYYTHTIYFTFFSFCGLTGIYKVIAKISQTQAKTLFAVLILFPSLLIFTSGNLKETVLMGTFGLFVYHLYFIQFSKKHIVYAIVFAFSLFLIKQHFILLFIPVLFSFLLCNLIVKQKRLHLFVYLAVFSLYFISASFILNLRNSQPIAYSIALTQQSAMKNAIFIKAGSYTRPPIIASSYISLIKNIPSAFYHALKYPCFGMNKTINVNLAGLENFLVKALVIITLLACLKKGNRFHQYHLAIIVFTFLFYSLIGFTQALEAIILRFKAPVLPLLISGVYLLLIQFRKQKAL